VPDEAVAFYVDALEKVVASEQFKEYMVQNSMAPHWVTGDDLDKALEREIEVFTKVATEMNLIEK
jgi:tripartite-type tricarboxylate transporter receptor subunit TctC